MPLQKSKKKKKKSDGDGNVTQNVKQSVVVNVGSDDKKKKRRRGRPRGKGKLSRPPPPPPPPSSGLTQQIFSPPNYPQQNLFRVAQPSQPPTLEPASLTPPSLTPTQTLPVPEPPRVSREMMARVAQSRQRPSLNSVMTPERVAPPAMANPLVPPPSEPSQLTPEFRSGGRSTESSASRLRSKTPVSPREPRVRFADPPMEASQLTPSVGQIREMVGETISDRSSSTTQRLVDTLQLAKKYKRAVSSKTPVQSSESGLRRSAPSSTIGQSPLSHGFAPPSEEQNPLFPDKADVYNDDRTPNLSVVKSRGGSKKKRIAVVIDKETGERIPIQVWKDRQKMGGEDFDAPTLGEMLGDEVRDEQNREAIEAERQRRAEQARQLANLDKVVNEELFIRAMESPAELSDVRPFLAYYIPEDEFAGFTPRGVADPFTYQEPDK